jgi:16S rRNA (cytosine967-C5)-methyltransferase
LSAAREPRRRPTTARDAPAHDVRRTAARLVDEALASRAPVDGLLVRSGASFDARDRRLLAELVYGTLRWLRRLDHVVAGAADRPLEQIDQALLAPLRVAALQLVELDRVPAHAAVSEAVDEIRRRGSRGAAGFANAVLRRIARRPRWEDWPVELADPVARLAVEGSHPEELVERWWRRFGEARARAIVAAGNAPRSLHLLAFADRGGRDALATALAAEGIVTRPSAVSPVGLVVERGQPLGSRAFARGELYVQDEASQAAALVPPPRAGERVLDAAAAPGGKGLALLAAQPAARVVFADSSLARLRRLDENLTRLAREAPRSVADASRPPWFAAFDRVVLDAPCTGTGTLRRHPELRWRFSREELERLAAASERMLRALVAALAPGGVLTLVTCSIEAEENEEIVARLLAAERSIEPLPLTTPGLPPGDLVDDASGRWRLFPGHGHDGFTVHAMRRHR